MNITLREITPQNFRRCIDLKVADGQENFVATNLMSIAQAKIYPTANPLAVYHEDEMVGFIMYSKAATLAIIEKMKQIEDCREIYLSFVPQNTVAEKLYSSVGFERTGKINEAGEVVMKFLL
ncbi:MAG: spermidine acetyltransferase [Acidobacteriota bacterium]|nr:spermidine acetyltransferase [Acidobacteriota bacterium]